mmetsp:Transcript_14075/g.47650  ORF Transcript_14075/g.47650 Transcript_14075/m.47650 type:complete len:194 (-) Transcript_14075:722-1303(-)
MAAGAAIEFPRRLEQRRVALFIDFQFEDLEATYPKTRLEEEGADVVVVGAHKAGTKYTGKHGYPVVSHVAAEDVDAADFHALVIPGGFAPDYMRRSAPMLAFIVRMLELGRPVAAICHGPWMLCSARHGPEQRPVCADVRLTSFVAIKDDVINAGGKWVDEAVVVDGCVITSRTPADLVPFCQAIIRETAARA